MRDRTIQISTDLVEGKYAFELPPGVTCVRAVRILGEDRDEEGMREEIRVNYRSENGFLFLEEPIPNGCAVIAEYDDPRPLWRALFEKVREVIVRFWHLKFRTAVKGDQ